MVSSLAVLLLLVAAATGLGCFLVAGISGVGASFLRFFFLLASAPGAGAAAAAAGAGASAAAACSALRFLLFFTLTTGPSMAALVGWPPTCRLRASCSACCKSHRHKLSAELLGTQAARTSSAIAAGERRVQAITCLWEPRASRAAEGTPGRCGSGAPHRGPQAGWRHDGG